MIMTANGTVETNEEARSLISGVCFSVFVLVFVYVTCQTC